MDKELREGISFLSMMVSPATFLIALFLIVGLYSKWISPVQITATIITLGLWTITMNWAIEEQDL